MEMNLYLLLALLIALLVIGYLLAKLLRVRDQLSLIKDALTDIKNGNLNRRVLARESDLTKQICYDINEIAMSSQSQLVQQKQSEQAYKRLMTSLSHDVKTPLASLVGYLEAVESKMVTGAEQEEYIRVATEKAHHLKDFVTALFEWVKLDAGEQIFHFELCDLNELSRNIMADWVPLLENHDLTYEIEILWIAGFATVMVGLIVFVQGQFTFYDRRYIDGAGWFMTAAQSLATFYVLPAVIALLGSYMICREEQEDTLKSLRLIPVDEVKLTLAKMILAFVFSVLIYLLLFAITFLVEAVLHLEALSVGLVLENLKIYFLDGVGVFFAISPIIALVARMKKGYWLALVFAEIYSFAGLFASMSQQLKTVYPMTAVFNISGYYDASMVQVLIGIIVLLACAVLALFILKGLNRKVK